MNKFFVLLALVLVTLTSCKKDKKMNCPQAIHVFESYAKQNNSGKKHLVYDFDQLKMWSIDTSINFAIKKDDGFSRVTSKVVIGGKETFTSEFSFDPLPQGYLKLSDDNKTNKFIQSQNFGEDARLVFQIKKEDGSVCEASYPIYR